VRLGPGVAIDVEVSRVALDGRIRDREVEVGVVRVAGAARLVRGVVDETAEEREGGGPAHGEWRQQAVEKGPAGRNDAPRAFMGCR
jgi:hypothetical protein